MIIENQITRLGRNLAPILSVMILTIPGREALVSNLLDVLGRQVDGPCAGVEVLVNHDLRTKSVGAKRQECLDAAYGKYVAFLDDDDMVTDDYLPRLLAAAGEGDPDVITFDQRAQINDSNPFTVNFSLRNPVNEQMKTPGGIYLDIKRPPWHMNAWRASIAKRHRFADKSWAEDWDWCERVLAEVNTEIHINRVLHLYQFRDGVSACPAK